MGKKLTGLVAGTLLLTMAACGTDENASSSAKTGLNANRGAKIGLAMPSKRQARWTLDSANMAEQFHDMDYKPIIKFADDNIESQPEQIQTMIDAGVKLLIVVAVEGASLNSVLAEAAAKHIPVIAYDHLITDTPNVDYYTSFDNTRVGELEASILTHGLGLPAAKGPFNVELVAGDPINGKIFFDGSMSVLKPYIDSGKLVVRSGRTRYTQVTTANWDGAIAAKRLNRQLANYYSTNRLDAVLAPNDNMALELIKELRRHGYGTRARPMPRISGQDGELSSVKAIIAGQQTGTVYKDTRELAKVAVQMGNALLTGSKPIINDTSSFNNGVKVVPAYLLPPVLVDKSNYTALLIDGGYYSEADLE